jgi:hypothetical protein
MDLVKDAYSIDAADGMRAAIRTVIFCGIPLGVIGIRLARDLLRRSAAPSPALHGIARFAIVLLTLNLGLLVLLTAALIEELLVEHGTSWYLLAFVAISWLVDCLGVNAWRTIRRETHDTHPISLVR